MKDKDRDVLLFSIAYAAFRLALCNTPFSNRVSARMRRPQVGDLVLEVTRGVRMRDLDALGYLEKQTDFDTYTIRTLGGKIVNWSNATCIAVPTEEIVRCEFE